MIRCKALERNTQLLNEQALISWVPVVYRLEIECLLFLLPTLAGKGKGEGFGTTGLGVWESVPRSPNINESHVHQEVRICREYLPPRRMYQVDITTPSRNRTLNSPSLRLHITIKHTRIYAKPRSCKRDRKETEREGGTREEGVLSTLK